MKKSGFTLQQHKTVGAQLVRICTQIDKIQTAARIAYPATSLANKHIERAITAIMNAQNELENAMFREGHDGAHTAVYYPGGSHNPQDAEGQL